MKLKNLIKKLVGKLNANADQEYFLNYLRQMMVVKKKEYIVLEDIEVAFDKVNG